MFSQIDKNFMELALNEAKTCYSRGDLPVGAVLTIDNNLEGIAGNYAKTNGDWISHAELSLLHKVSWKIKKDGGKMSRLYTTWETCSMCAHASSICRVDEIIYACPDPIGGAAKTNPEYLVSWSKKHWPKFREGPFKKESYNLLVKYMEENKRWANFLKKFKSLSL